ncbi:hypothetical protein [Curtobacterium citreum]|uniref:hypothetical protein n=1 Tax=Curtobacterium citreum TaxID=2036 RepID=UPI0025435DF1|nr:hypothetical protein [Curtobacterium citreum]WIJ45594.1 hypothetical protein QPK07_01140 [Curtobacterium citreum]
MPDHHMPSDWPMTPMPDPAERGLTVTIGHGNPPASAGPLLGHEPPVEVLPVFRDDGRLASVEVTYFLTDPDGIPAGSSLTARWPR